RRFIAGRALLRGGLALYLALAPWDVELDYGEQGKPRLREGRGLEFNLSHSGDIAMLAVGARRLGVDVERRRTSRDLDAIARRYFSPPEVDEYQSLPKSERLPAFYRCWARKEAYLKARGGGLTTPLDQFAVTLLPGVASEIVWTDVDPAGHPGWDLLAFDPGDRCEGAVCIERHPANGPPLLRTWIWSPGGELPRIVPR
ncbi:MAG: 4'-phosphopantetheinyl transferase superfamily protein, partial [Planctomycetes bacterium]|nr:4'-phosphopantetheinyl transferase superfamily protein [Planctomycetota bacterium]